MNFFRTPAEIIAIPITEKERNHESRQRHAYHIFVSMFFKKFKELNYDEKKETLQELRLWRYNDNGYESDDSVITQPQATVGDIIRAAGKVWRESSLEIRNAWKERADRLNSRELSDGTFDYIPGVLIVDRNSLRQNVMLSLTADWKYTGKMLKTALVLNKKKICVNAYNSYKFGNERVVLYTQTYRSFLMNHMLKLTIFGSPLFSNLQNHEVPYRMRNQTVLHFYSYRRITELLTFGGLEATCIYKDNLKYIMCLQVNLKRGRRNIIGYVVDEDENDRIVIKVEGENEKVYIPRPIYNAHEGKFDFNPCRDQTLTYQLSQFWPIRMKINASGTVSIIFSVYSFTLDEDTGLDNITSDVI